MEKVFGLLRSLLKGKQLFCERLSDPASLSPHGIQRFCPLVISLFLDTAEQFLLFGKIMVRIVYRKEIIRAVPFFPRAVPCFSVV